MNPFTIKKILVPVDLSESSLNALDTAVALAARHHAELRILNIDERGLDVLKEDMLFPTASTSYNASHIIMALSGSIQHAHDILPEILEEQGNVGDTIIRMCTLYQADLIVMGTHGASGFRDGFMGSNTYNVIKRAICPVLSVPGKKKYSSFNKVLYPVRPVTGALCRYDILRNFIGPKSVLNVLGLSYKKMEQDTGVLETIVEEIRIQIDADEVSPSVSWGSGEVISENVIKYNQQNVHDLVVITSVIDITAKPQFIGPHTQKIIHCLKTPILSIKKIGVPSYS